MNHGFSSNGLALREKWKRDREKRKGAGKVATPRGVIYAAIENARRLGGRSFVEKGRANPRRGKLELDAIVWDRINGKVRK